MTSTSADIRLLTIEDVAIFRDLRLRGLKEEPTAFVDAYEDAVMWPIERFEKWFESGWIAGAFIGSTLVGIAGIHKFYGLKVQHKGRLWGVYVTPEARGQRLARRIIELLLKTAEKAGLELILLGAEEGNAITLALYQSLGFDACGIEKHTFKLADRYINDVLMIKFLK